MKVTEIKIEGRSGYAASLSRKGSQVVALITRPEGELGSPRMTANADVPSHAAQLASQLFKTLHGQHIGKLHQSRLEACGQLVLRPAKKGN